MTEQMTDLPSSIPELASQVLNHEAKLVVLMTLDGQPSALTCSQLHKQMTEPQQDYTTWTPSNMTGYQYCRQSLVPAGAVTEELVTTPRQANVRAHRLTEYGQRLAVPGAGFLSDWSLRYPNVSIQDLLGGTNSSGEFRAGETRTRVLEAALANPSGDNLSVRAAFAEGVDPDWESVEYKLERTRVSKAVSALALAGVLNSETVQFDDDRELLIVDPQMPEGLANHPHFEVAIALYEVLATLDAQREDKDSPLAISYDEAIVLTLNRLTEQGIDADVQKVRRGIHNAYFSERSYKGITKADPGRFNDGRLTRFSMNDAHRDAVEEFLLILQVLEDGNDRTYAEGHAMLQSVKSNSAQRAQLMSKAFTFSPYAQKKSTLTTAAEVKTLITEIGQATLDELADAYRDMANRPIKSEGLRNILVLLLAQGRIAVEATTNSDKPGYGQKRHVYSSVD